MGEGSAPALPFICRSKAAFRAAAQARDQADVAQKKRQAGRNRDRRQQLAAEIGIERRIIAAEIIGAVVDPKIGDQPLERLAAIAVEQIERLGEVVRKSAARCVGNHAVDPKLSGLKIRDEYVPAVDASSDPQRPDACIVGDLPPWRPSFMTRVCWFDICRFWVAQARRVLRPQIAQGPGALARVSGCQEMNVA
jgi:hypothetical protein